MCLVHRMLGAPSQLLGIGLPLDKGPVGLLDKVPDGDQEVRMAWQPGSGAELSGHQCNIAEAIMLRPWLTPAPNPALP